ncbi:hepatocyte growth factor isoform X1 [Chiloscyllium plagiosum]|uniref:hepatocyte growth factor isoform X1 n=2 Tax=Chiloscyllium plagiosum TaxID=36176 RepID=UPI001CB7FD5D|nr:hepatocyte growth factor isoform X1 [Chiloscyllium plagiosum]
MMGTIRLLLLLSTLMLAVDSMTTRKNALHNFLKTSGHVLIKKSLQQKSKRMDNIEQCAKRCMKFKGFVCRAFYFGKSEKRCYWLSFNSKTKGVKGKPDKAFDLYERKDYIRECIIGKGKNYRGTKSVTESGQTCQHWNSTIPHDHRFLPSNNRNKNLKENYCRNPTDDEGGPWCFTMHPRIRLESCAIPQCSEVECMTCNGETYRGPMDHTKSGKECQRWDLQMPHKHRFNPERYPDKGLDDNYCRNPDGRTKPWCYTLDPHTPWEYCDIKECVHNCDHDLEVTTECFKDLGESYRGTMNTTPSGIPCQRWDVQYPHQHNFTPENYKCKDLDKNYCRNPDGREAPWCFTTDPEIRVAYCFHIPRCENKTPISEECYQGTGTTYRGSVSKTRTGIHCAPWVNYSQAIARITLDTNTESLAENYCRNPDADKHGPWCYTSDPLTPWDYCAIEPCDKTTSSESASAVQFPGTRQCSSRIQTRIVNGFRATAKTSSWMVSLRHRDIHFCGGSLIEQNWVLTAKHCFSTCKPDLRGYEAVMGILKDDKSEEAHKQVREISQLVCGPDGSNLVMLKLSRPVKSTSYVHWIKLPQPGCEISEGTLCNISGWGETKDTGYEGELKVAQIPIIGNKKCNEYHQGKIQINESEICAGDEKGTVGTCERDYGGPLVCEEHNQSLLQGVIIPGRGCAKPKRPGIFVRVSYYVTWIHKVCKTYKKHNRIG